MSVNRVLQLADARWDRLGRQRPELGAAIQLQRRLVRRSLDLAAVIGRDLPLRVGLAPADIASRLRLRRPAFAGVTFEVDASALRPYVLGFCDDLADGGAGAPARRLRQTLERGEVDIGSLLSASLMRRLQAVRTTANHVGVAPDLLWLVGELGAAPLANRLQREHLSKAATAHGELRASLSAWDEGGCPACGSWPALAERLGEARQLRCSFCGAAWQPARYRCIYCGEADDAFLTAAADDSDATRRLELCRTCGGYLKSVAFDMTIPVELLTVEDLVSSDLDISAVQRGYTRPPMQEIETV